MKQGEASQTAVHKAVLLDEVIDYLDVSPGKRYIDATLGQAGHALEMARHGGEVLGIEANQKTFDWVNQFLSNQNEDLKRQIKVVLGNFVDLDRIARNQGFSSVDGILFDLGLSTLELRNGGLGFSFLTNEPLDMRLDQDAQTKAAADLVNRGDARELYRILIKYGEERDAHKIVGSIIKGRKLRKIETTFDLVSLIDSAYQSKSSKDERRELKNHRAKVFQALRIAVNRELENLQVALPKAFGLIRKGGRLCVITFHSLEDRVVKNYFRESQRMGRGKLVVEKPLTPGRLEIEENYSARSAKLRILEKYDSKN